MSGTTEDKQEKMALEMAASASMPRVKRAMNTCCRFFR
jgi:hypothetical protein